MAMSTIAGQTAEQGHGEPASIGPVDTFQSTNVDLLLAVLVAVAMPLAAAWLLEFTGGAAAGLFLYYGICCVGVVLWRRGTLGYHQVHYWPWRLFVVSLVTPGLITALNWNFLPRVVDPWPGIVLTLLIWAPLNAAMEQMAWFYVLDAWRFRWQSGVGRWFGLVVGIVLLLVLVALIHIFFWAQFLPTAQETAPAWARTAQQLLYYPLVASYWLLYQQSRSMWPTFVVHLLVDAQLVLIAGYSLVPFL